MCREILKMSAFPDTPLPPTPPPPPVEKGDESIFPKIVECIITAVVLAIIVFRLLPFPHRAEIRSDGSTWYATHAPRVHRHQPEILRPT